MSIITSSRPTSIFLGACRDCQRPVRVNDPDATTRHTSTACPQCDKQVVAERIHGVTTANPCHDACMGASGPSCSCACGGRNHGGVWEESSERLESALEAYRARLAAQAAAEAAKEAKAAAKAARERERARAEFEQWMTDTDSHAMVEWLTSPDAPHTPFIDDMSDIVRRYQPLTERQAAAVGKWHANHLARLERQAAEAAEPKNPVPTGQGIEITGEIAHIFQKETYYSYHGEISYKMLVKGDGWKVWATVPSQLKPREISAGWFDEWRDSLVGREITFTATVTASRDDDSSGNAKRPRNVHLSPAAE